MAEPSRELENSTFVKKMILILVAIVVTGALQFALKRDPAFWDATPVRARWAKVLAVASLALFVAIVFAGRLIAYTDHP